MPKMADTAEKGSTVEKRRWPSPFQKWRQFVLQKGSSSKQDPLLKVVTPLPTAAAATPSPLFMSVDTPLEAWPQAGPPPPAPPPSKASLRAKRLSKELERMTTAFESIVLPTLEENKWVRKSSNGALSAQSYWTAAVSMTSSCSSVCQSPPAIVKEPLPRHSEGCSSCHSSLSINHGIPQPLTPPQSISVTPTPGHLFEQLPVDEDFHGLPSPTTTVASPHFATLRSVTSLTDSIDPLKSIEAVSSSRSSSRAASTHPSSLLEEQQSVYYTKKYGKSISARIEDGTNIKTSDFVRIKLIGKGDVGKVYLVKEKATDQLFAMKVLSKKVCFYSHVSVLNRL